MKAVAIIPARLASTRLPRKPLRLIAGKPMLQRVYEAARASKALDEVVVATDSAEILDLCQQNGWRAEMTSESCRSGTERVYELSQRIAADVYVNVQGDEPLARSEHLDLLLELMQRPGVEVGTLMTRCPFEDVANPNAVKIVTSLTGRALYFSRSTIPFDRDGIGCEKAGGNKAGGVRYRKHLGFYAYTASALNSFYKWPESELERTERLEQLRFLDHDVEIYAAETPYDTVGVDTEDDLRRVEEILKKEGRE